MAYCDDVDKAMEKSMAGVLTLDRHSKVGREELSRKWNIGLEMVKATLDMMMQHGVPTVVHPMSRWLRVDNLHLHRPRLKGSNLVFGYFNQKGKVIFYQNAGIYGCRRKMSTLGCGITV
jgi:hypothetical protein